MKRKPESAVQSAILLALGSHPDVRLFSNPVGEAWAGRTVRAEGGAVLLANASRVRYGLAIGSADLVGVRRLVITPDMVGRTVGVFLSVEVKAEDGSPGPGQIPWRDMVRAMGGLAGIARSPEEALLIAGLPA